MHNDRADCGVLVLRDDGGVIFRAGVADDDGMLQRLRHLGSQPFRRILPVASGDASYVALSRPIDCRTTLILVLPGERADELIEFLATVDFAPDILNKLLASPFDGMTVVDSKGRIAFLSPVHERFFGLKRGEARGRHVTEVIENTRLHTVAETGQAEIGQVQHMHGTSRIVTRTPVLRDGKVIGAIGRIMFKGPEQLIAMSRELSALKNEVEYYKREARLLRNRTYGIDDIIGDSKAVRKLKSDMARVARMDVPVLLLGESGTGKELVAHGIHRLSMRREKSMVMVNASALPENLVESELFGYEPGAFTGAQKKGRRGKFEAAHDSSLFLDEIGDMPLDVQVKLLRVLQDGSFERIGGDHPRHSDFRLITATNRDITSMIDGEQFRLDLYYRISGVTLRLPPLRERVEDIPALVQHFVRSFVTRQGSSVSRIDPKVYRYLQRRPWPGNVRQLLHEVERAMIFCDSSELTVEDFRPSEIFQEPIPTDTDPQQGETLKDTLERVELSAIMEAMARHDGNKKKVAEELGISRSYLYKRLEQLESR